MNFNLLPLCLLLSAVPFMLGAVVLDDKNAEIKQPFGVDSDESAMPPAHGPVLDLPTEPVILPQNPAVLDQPIKPADSANEKTAAKTTQDEKTTKPAAEKPSDKNATPKTSETKTDAPAKQQPQQSQPKPPAQTALAPLSPEMESLRKGVRQAIDYYGRQPLNTNDNTAEHVLKACLAFGCDTVVLQGGPSGEQVNGFTCLCWNYPCGGYNLLKLVDGRVSARVGHGLQSNPAEFLAVLALARVPREYPVRVGNTVRTVADLVVSEKLACRSGEDNSFRLIGLARYLPIDDEWKNALGETWSIERMLKEELDAAQQPSPCGGTHRLMAISYAVDRQEKSGLPLEGQFARAKKYVDKYQGYALALQNPDGSWHPDFFKYQGEGGTTVGQINSTGHIMAWLALSLPDDKLDDPAVVRGIAFLANSLTGRRLGSLASTSSTDIAARMTAVHALIAYDARVFSPYDEAEAAKPAPEKTAAGKTANVR